MKDAPLIARLRELVAGEDPKNPLTDQELSEALNTSRSNITTLRQLAGITNSRERREPRLLQDLAVLTRSGDAASARSLTARLNQMGYRITLNSVLQYLRGRDGAQARTPQALAGAAAQTGEPGEPAGEDIFAKIVGHDGSLAHQVDQAKASVLYPPYGLHTLIIGESGVGKSMLAEAMYHFSLTGAPDGAPRRPYVEFNCADYAENPQLLAAQLFGYVSGAFTGAVGSREGLISTADGGIFFLDEVHRMPPDGQEMLFQLIDKGTYRPVGDKQVKKANVMIIAATTEDIEQSLLTTFRRRIPMVIHMPSLEDRAPEEKLALISLFFQVEASRIRKDILVEGSALRQLLGTRYAGNIGELRSSIQVSCARAYLSYVLEHGGDGCVRVAAKSLLPADADPDRAQQAARLVPGDLIFPADGTGSVAAFRMKDPYEFSDEIYRTIDAQYEKLLSYPISSQELNATICELVEKKIGRYLGRLQAQSVPYPGGADALGKLVDSAVTDMVREMLAIARNELGFRDEALLFLLSTHLSSALQRLKAGSRIRNPHLTQIKHQHPKEYLAASRMAECSVKHLGVALPEEEIGFVAMYLAASDVNIHQDPPTIGLIVATHGKVASEMANVAGSLMGATCVTALDIGLDEHTDHIYRRLREKVIACDQGRGVLILADMGSPEAFGARISRETGIVTRTVTRVDTLMVLDAVRKVYLPELDIDDVAASLVEAKKSLILGADQDEAQPRRNAILTCCLTGDGYAAYLKTWLEQTIAPLNLQAEVIRLGALRSADFQRQLRRLQKQYNVLGVASTFQVELEGVPYLLFSQLKDEVAVSAFLRRLARQARLHAEPGAPAAPAELRALFRPENVLRDVDVSDKETAIRMLCEALEADSCVTPTYLHTVLGRETLSSTGISSHVAIPHGDCAEVLRPSVGVLLPRRPVDWGGGVQVRMVLLLAFPEASAGLFPALCHIVTDEGAVDQALRCRTREEVARCLCRLI